MILEELSQKNSWFNFIAQESGKPYFLAILEYLNESINNNKIIFPEKSKILNAFKLTPFEKVKVVIIGQDPYHGIGQANGLAFSVNQNVKIPPSLHNIYKELVSDVNIDYPKHGDLSQWTSQGVFLLNAILTVEKEKAASHQKIGWQSFTDAVIQKLSNEHEGLVFLLWGNFAKSKKNLIDTQRHFVLESAHPSPLARGAFMGCRHFSTTNEILKNQSKSIIDWRIN